MPPQAGFQGLQLRGDPRADPGHTEEDGWTSKSLKIDLTRLSSLLDTTF